MKFLLPLVCAAALLTACSGKNDTPATAGTTPAATTANASVAELNQQFISAWNSKDAAKAAALLADDAQFLQGEMHLSGKSEITNKWITPTISTISSLKTSVLSSGTDANLAYEAGTFAVDVLPASAGQEAGTGEGNYLFLWKKASDGTWKLSLAQLEDLPVRAKR